ncbi:uncharacterized protein ACO6RY_19816 [Pungitius sinensis]
MESMLYFLDWYQVREHLGAVTARLPAARDEPPFRSLPTPTRLPDRGEDGEDGAAVDVMVGKTIRWVGRAESNVPNCLELIANPIKAGNAAY